MVNGDSYYGEPPCWANLLCCSISALLQLNHRFLAHLELHLHFVDIYRHLVSTLEVCSKLESLSLDLGSLDHLTKTTGPTSPSRYLKLKHLKLRGASLSLIRVGDLLSWCLDLEFLSLCVAPRRSFASPNPYTDILQAAYDHWPGLASLELVSETTRFSCGEMATDIPAAAYDLRILRQCGTLDEVDDILSRFIQCYYGTLENIRFDINLRPLHSASRRTLMTSGFPGLRKLSLCECYADRNEDQKIVVRDLLRIMQHQPPVLEEVQLSGINLRYWHQILHSMGNLKSLKRLQLTCCRCTPQEGLRFLIVRSPNLEQLTIGKNRMDSLRAGRQQQFRTRCQVNNLGIWNLTTWVSPTRWWIQRSL